MGADRRYLLGAIDPKSKGNYDVVGIPYPGEGEPHRESNVLFMTEAFVGFTMRLACDSQSTLRIAQTQSRVRIRPFIRWRELSWGRSQGRRNSSQLILVCLGRAIRMVKTVQCPSSNLPPGLEETMIVMIIAFDWGRSCSTDQSHSIQLQRWTSRCSA